MNTLNHIGITVTDLDASVAFYRDVVGFEFFKDGVKTGGEWFDTLTHNHGAVIDGAMLRMGAIVLQLVKYHEGGKEPSQTGHARAGNLHLAVNVEDVDAKHAEVMALGAHNPTPIVDIMGGGNRSFYVEDPDGVPVELFQARPTGVHAG